VDPNSPDSYIPRRYIDLLGWGPLDEGEGDFFEFAFTVSWVGEFHCRLPIVEIRLEVIVLGQDILGGRPQLLTTEGLTLIADWLDG
jgi:hypothetical protein